MKRILTILLTALSLTTFAQIQTAPPTGSKTYGTTTFIAPDGMLWYGTNPLKYRGVYPKTKIDSLLALIAPFDASLYYTKVASDARFYPLSTNPAGYLTSFTELDPTVPSYAKSLTAFSVIKTSTDALYPTLTGGNASGTWNINVLGNASTVTNGVYTASSYNDPEWIDSLAYSKLTGAPDLSGYELLANKQSSLTTDGTGVKYPTVDAVNAGSMAFKGFFTSKAVLDAATFNPIQKAGDEAIVNEGIGKSVVKYTYNVGIKPWTLSSGTFSGLWSAGTYNEGDVVQNGDYAYLCLTTNSTEPRLLISPNWIKLGFYKGAYSGATTYDNGDVISSGTSVYISNASLNDYSLATVTINSWLPVSNSPSIGVSWGDSLTEGFGSTGDGSYPSQLGQRIGFTFLNRGVSGETSTQVKDRFLNAPETWGKATIIWAGRNNYPDTAVVLADINTMVSKLTTDRYVVVGIIKSAIDGEPQPEIDSLNKRLKNIYGIRFIDAQSYLFSIYDPLNPLDVDAHAEGHIAWSLRSDWLHLNNRGYYLIANYIASRYAVLFGNSAPVYSSVSAKGVYVMPGNQPPEVPGLSIENVLRDDGIYAAVPEAFTNPYNRITNNAIPYNIGSSSDAVIRLIPNGGTLEVNPNTYSSGAYRTLVIGENSGKGEIFAKPLSVPTWQEVMSQGHSTTTTAEINATENSGFAFSVTNNGATNGHGVIIDGGTSTGGIPLYIGKNGAEIFRVSNDSKVKVAPTPVDPTDVVRLTDLGNYVNTTGNQTGIAGNKTWTGSHTHELGTTSLWGSFASDFTSIQTGQIQVSNPAVDQTIVMSAAWIQLQSAAGVNGQIKGNISGSGLEWTLPNASGTLALTTGSVISIPADANYTIVGGDINGFYRLPLNSSSTGYDLTWPNPATYPGGTITIQCLDDPRATNFNWAMITNPPKDEFGVTFDVLEAGVNTGSDVSTSDALTRVFVFKSDGVNWVCTNGKYRQVFP